MKFEMIKKEQKCVMFQKKKKKKKKGVRNKDDIMII